MQRDLTANGLLVVPHFLDTSTCEALLRKINRYRQQQPLPKIYRPSGDRPLNYSVIDGERLRQSFPELFELYLGVIGFIKTAAGAEEVAPLDDMRVACNVNITANGGTYRYHYDRNGITAILYLNETVGGETECYPNYRIDLRVRNYARFQYRLDQLLQSRVLRLMSGKQTLVKPETGKLLIMRGDRCLHSVRPVRSSRARVNIVMAYDYPGSCQAAGSDDLNRYLYDDGHAPSSDPNYKA